MARLANAISTVKTSVSFCEECGNVSETKLCTICRDERRDPSVLCVVEESKDVVAIELTRSFTGRYHVLGGAINPLAGVGPEQLRIRELVSRLADERIQEIILAMDPNLEGEATATYLSRMLVPLGVRLSRLASGLPVGGDLEYADEITLGRALEGRRVISEGTAVAHTAAEDFERVNREEEQEREQAAQVQAQEAKQSRRRWNSSMFDDLDSEDSAGSRTEAPAGVQGTVDEQLIEQVLQDAEESHAGACLLYTSIRSFSWSCCVLVCFCLRRRVLPVALRLRRWLLACRFWSAAWLLVLLVPRVPLVLPRRRAACLRLVRRVWRRLV